MNMSEFNKLHEHLKSCVDSNNGSRIAMINGWAFGLSVKAKKEHDQLTSENARLREALKESNEVLRRNLSKYFYKDEASMLNALERNKKLLTELEKGDE